MTKFKQGSWYFAGNGYDDMVYIVGFNKNGIIWKRTSGKKFTSKYTECATGHKYFFTNNGKKVYSWNISSLHELRKNDLLKNLAKELEGRKIYGN